jgi:hypothetical protein
MAGEAINSQSWPVVFHEGSTLDIFSNQEVGARQDVCTAPCQYMCSLQSVTWAIHRILQNVQRVTNNMLPSRQAPCRPARFNAGGCLVNWAGRINWACDRSVNSFAPSCLPADSFTQVVVLSPDAVEPLLNIEPGTVYVVGGIVDRTVVKGTTAGFAVSATCDRATDWLVMAPRPSSSLVHGMHWVKNWMCMLSPKLAICMSDSSARNAA